MYCAQKARVKEKGDEKYYDDDILLNGPRLQCFPVPHVLDRGHGAIYVGIIY